MGSRERQMKKDLLVSYPVDEAFSSASSQGCAVGATDRNHGLWIAVSHQPLKLPLDVLVSCELSGKTRRISGRGPYSKPRPCGQGELPQRLREETPTESQLRMGNVKFLKKLSAWVTRKKNLSIWVYLRKNFFRLGFSPCLQQLCDVLNC